MTTNASLFAQNRDEVITPILPPDVNSPAQMMSPNVSAFSRAVNNDVRPQEPGLTSIVPAVANNNDGQRVANDAIGVGQTLRAGDTTGMAVQQSDAAYLGKSVLDAGAKVATGLLGILSDEHASNDLDGNGIPDDMENNTKVAVAPPQFSLPSMTGGMSGPGGMGG